MEIFLAILFIVALLAAFFLRRAGDMTGKAAGLPRGARVIYSDTGAWKRVERPLFSKKYRLSGKPDYIVEVERDVTIPIEVKPNRRDAVPRASDTMQLMAYGVLIEEEFGRACSYGLLTYRDVVFQIDFTNELRQEFFQILEEMRLDHQASNVHRSHTDSTRCRYCGYRQDCDERLA